MNVEMAYLLGMIMGNGTIQRDSMNTSVSIRIPYKKRKTETEESAELYVRASFADIQRILQPLIGVTLYLNSTDRYATINFTKPNGEYLVREILRYVDNQLSCRSMRISDDIFNSSVNEKWAFLRGLADVTGYIRKTNWGYKKYQHRVYIEIPGNWYLTVDVCNLLKQIGIPVQDIDWAHPNFRDSDLIHYNHGNPTFWKKEHQIKIWVTNFLSIGFGILHKKNDLELLVNEMVDGLINNGQDPHTFGKKFYWQTYVRGKGHPLHPAENDSSLPEQIRGKHYDHWQDIARDLGYGEDT